MERLCLALSAIAIAGLVTIRVNDLRMVKYYSHFARESRLLTTYFDINKTIFRNWAEHVGIMSGHVLNKARHHPLLDRSVISSLVQHTLFCIRDIYNAT